MPTTPYDREQDDRYHAELSVVTPEAQQIYERFILAAWKQDQDPIAVMLGLLADYAQLYDPVSE